MYVCMYVTLNCGGIVGGGGTIKQFLLIFLFIVSLIIYNRIMFIFYNLEVLLSISYCEVPNTICHNTFVTPCLTKNDKTKYKILE